MSDLSGQGSDGKPATGAVAFVVSLLVLCGFMYFTYTYPYPSGRPPSWGSFVVFWLREIVILLLALVVALTIAASWVQRVFRKWRDKA